MNQKPETEGSLSIRCEVLRACNSLFRIKILGDAGNIAVCRVTEAGEWTRFRLPAGRYTVQARSCFGLNPGGIVKWLRMVPGENRSMRFLFSHPLCIPGVVPVDFTVSDANYPGITDLNGGITVWRHPIIP